MQYGKIYDSPIGLLHLQCNDTHITALSFYHAGPILQLNHPLLDKACTQLDEYFQGKRKVFTLPLLIEGTPFQKQVYAALLSIEYGQTASYEEIAIKIGNPKACRAVGMANNRNRIALFIPCHRVVGKDGSLVGYEGGIQTKGWLLSLEHAYRNT